MSYEHDSAARYWQLAGEARQLAEAAGDPTLQWKLALQAANFLHLAEQVESAQADQPMAD